MGRLPRRPIVVAPWSRLGFSLLSLVLLFSLVLILGLVILLGLVTLLQEERSHGLRRAGSESSS